MKPIDISNKIINTGNAYIKLGKVSDCDSHAGYFCEVLDFVGELKTYPWKLEDKKYMILSYTQASAAGQNTEVTEEQFNLRLVEAIIDDSIKTNDAFNLSFMRTEERIAMLRVLRRKQPKISFNGV